MAKPVKSTTKNADSTKGKPWTFPKHTLEEAIEVPKAIEEKNAGNPIHSMDLCKILGFYSTSDWRFLDILKSANQYGLVNGSGRKATISIEKLGQQIISPSSAAERKQALLEAFRKV